MPRPCGCCTARSEMRPRTPARRTGRGLFPASRVCVCVCVCVWGGAAWCGSPCRSRPQRPPPSLRLRRASCERRCGGDRRARPRPQRAKRAVLVLVLREPRTRTRTKDEGRGKEPGLQPGRSEGREPRGPGPCHAGAWRSRGGGPRFSWHPLFGRRLRRRLRITTASGLALSAFQHFSVSAFSSCVLPRPRPDNATHGVARLRRRLRRASRAREPRCPAPHACLPPRESHPENRAAHHLRAFALQKHAKQSHSNTFRKPAGEDCGMSCAALRLLSAGERGRLRARCPPPGGRRGRRP